MTVLQKMEGWKDVGLFSPDVSFLPYSLTIVIFSHFCLHLLWGIFWFCVPFSFLFISVFIGNLLLLYLRWSGWWSEGKVLDPFPRGSPSFSTCTGTGIPLTIAISWQASGYPLVEEERLVCERLQGLISAILL